jgi:hypothetical protein
VIAENRASIILFNVLVGLRKRNKKFLLPANICPIVALTYLKAGVDFELVDISEKSLCLDEQIIIDRLLSKPGVYGGVHYVRTYGIENQPKRFFQTLKSIDQSVFVIDDKCLNAPVFRVQPLPEWIDLEFFSTGYSKFVDIGYGGFGYLQSGYKYIRNEFSYSALALEKLTYDVKKCLEMKSALEYKDSNWLGPSKLSFTVDAYQYLIQSKIEGVIAHKKSLNSIYIKELPMGIQFPFELQNWRFNIKIPKRDILLKKITEAGLFASAHYAPLNHMFPGDMAPKAEQDNIETLNLFNDFRFDGHKAKKVTEIINEHLISCNFS